MNLQEQFKVIFYSITYGMFFLASYILFRKLQLKKKIFKILLEFIFCIFHIILFYYLLYKINFGVITVYAILFLFVGGFFCHLLYFKNERH